MVHGETEDNLIVALAAGDTERALHLLETCPIDLTILLETAGRHMISTIVLQRLAALSLPEDLKSEVAAAARHAVVSALASSAAIRKELHRLAELLEPAGIEFMLIKGFAIDKNPLRRMNDIDILIRRSELDS
ncbi:MAG: hypothetical protein EA426_17810, partial [Spirochaetaceae bacterium]